MRLLIMLVLPVFLVTSCSLNLDLDEQDTITQQDVEAISQIIGESLSDENAGIIGSFYDAITDISSTGFVRSTEALAKSEGHDDNTGRGSESEITYRYLSGTGEHELSFQRLVNTNGYMKQVVDTLRYIYTNQSGQFIADLSSVEGNTSSIEFTAARDGEIQAPFRASFFSRKDTFLIDGVEGSSSELIIDGVHKGEGYFQSITSADSTRFERTYELEVNFLNIRINKSIIDQNISLEQGVSGALTYTLIIRDPNDNNISRTIQGSLELVGDGTATLRFSNAPGLFQVNLDNGSINNVSREFEGRITSVNLSRSTFTLASGITVQVHDMTDISVESDLFTLEAVSNTLLSTPYVRAEGTGFLQGEVFRASKVEYEIDEDNDDENDDLEFEKTVESVDLANYTFALVDGTVIGVDDATVFESDGDYLSLPEVAEALNNEVRVVADGNARYIDTDSLNYIANEVEFEAAEVGGEGGSGEGEEEVTINFGGDVVSIDETAGTIILDTGAVIQITEETEIGGDLISLQEVRTALDAGQQIEADGKAIEYKESQEIDLTALDIEFEVEN